MNRGRIILFASLAAISLAEPALAQPKKPAAAKPAAAAAKAPVVLKAKGAKDEAGPVVAYAGATVHLGNGEVIDDATVVVANGKIQQIGKGDMTEHERAVGIYATTKRCCSRVQHAPLSQNQPVQEVRSC